jgi:hypothetical protein
MLIHITHSIIFVLRLIVLVGYIQYKTCFLHQINQQLRHFGGVVNALAC